MSRIRLGLIGYGHWTREAYVPTLRMLDDVEVTAVAARSEASQQRAREELGEGVRTTGDYREVVSDESVEAVLVAVPNELHREVAEAALAHDKHLFLELPIALTRGDTNAVFDAAQSSEQVVQFDLELRYMPVAQEVERGGVGTPLSATVELSANWGYGGGDFAEPSALEGFYLWVGVWYLDMLDLMLAGPEPRDAHVRGIRAMNGPMLDHGHAVIEYEGGAMGCFTHSILSPREGTFVTGRLLGDAGEVVIDFQEGTLTKYSPGGVVERQEHPPKQPVFAWAGMRESIESFVSAIRDGTPVVANAQVTRRAHEATFLCHEADRALRKLTA